MDSPVLACAVGPAIGATNYTALVPQRSWTTNETICRTPCGAAGTISNLRIRASNALTAGSYAFTLRQGSAPSGGGAGGAMADTAITCTLDASNQEAADTTHTITVAEGDELTLKSVPTGTPTAITTVYFSYVFTSAATGQSYVCFSQQSSSTVTTAYLPLGMHGIIATTENQAAQSVSGTAGNFTKLFISLTAAPGAGVTITYTLRVNGVDSGLSVAITGTNVSGNASATVAIAAGDVLDISRVVTGGTPAASLCFGALQWRPTIDGESLLFAGWNGNIVSATGTIYASAHGQAVSNQTTEANASNIAPCAFTWKKAFLNADAGPGASKTRDITARLGGVSQALTMDIAGAGTGAGVSTQSDTAHSVAVSTSDLIDWTEIPGGSSPTAAHIAVGSVAFIAPAGGSPLKGFLGLLGAGS